MCALPPCCFCLLNSCTSVLRIHHTVSGVVSQDPDQLSPTVSCCIHPEGLGSYLRKTTMYLQGRSS